MPQHMLNKPDPRQTSLVSMGAWGQQGNVECGRGGQREGDHVGG